MAAWGPDAPTSIIATLADDWDHATDERARIGLIAPDATAQGIVGGTWYLEHDRDDLVFGAGDPVDDRGLVGPLRVRRRRDLGHPRRGAGRWRFAHGRADASVGPVDQGARARHDVRAHRDRPRHSRSENGTSTVSVGSVVRGVNAATGAPVVASAVAGGLFLDQDVMAANEITSDDVVRAMESLKAPGGGRLFADAYPGFAVGFSRYC